MVFIETNRFLAWERQHAPSVSLSLPVATQCTHELIHYALEALRQIYKPGYGYHKAGVMMLELVPAGEIQTSLLDTQDRGKLDQLMHVLDQVNHDHGQGKLRYAAEGMGKRWKMRQEHRSQRFTTDWRELMTVRANM